MSIEQEVAIAGVLGLNLRETTKDILVRETLNLTGAITELVQKGNSDSLREAAELVDQKNQIADILHGSSEHGFK